MKRFLASLTVVAFVAVMQVLPALHRIYGCPCHPRAAHVAHARHVPDFYARCNDAPENQCAPACSCHGADESGTRGHASAFSAGGDCPVCQLALLPTESASTAVSVVSGTALFAEYAVCPHAEVAAVQAREPTQARAPPARV